MGFKYLWVLFFMSDSKLERELARRVAAWPAVTEALHRYVVSVPYSQVEARAGT